MQGGADIISCSGPAQHDDHSGVNYAIPGGLACANGLEGICPVLLSR